MKVLVLDAFASAALATIQALGRQGIELHALGPATSLSFKSRYLTKRLEYPTDFESSQMLEWLSDLDNIENYQLIIPTTEISLRLIQRCNDDDLFRKKCILPSQASVDIALDKMETWRVARRLDIPVPESTLVHAESDSDAENYPLVLKPLKSQVQHEGKLTYVAPCVAKSSYEKNEYLSKWIKYTTIQQQEYVPGHGVGIECLYVNGRMRWSFAHQRIHEFPLTGGASSYRRSISCPPGLLDCARKLLDSLNWHGVAMVEFRVADDGQFRLLEINPRLWGSLPLAINAGVNFPLALFQLALSQEVPVQPLYKTNIYMRNFRSDVYWMVENFRADHTDPMLLTRGKLKSITEWMRPLIGRESWDHFDWRDIRPISAQVLATLSRLFNGICSRLIDYYKVTEMYVRHNRNLWHIRQSQHSQKKLMFVCYGNICRSPLAEAVAKPQLDNWDITSTGLFEKSNRATPERIVELAREFGVDLNDHRSRSVTSEMITSANIIVIMDSKNYDEILSRFPLATRKILFLGMMINHFRGHTIPDPFNLCDSGVRKSSRQVIEGVNRLVRLLETK